MPNCMWLMCMYTHEVSWFVPDSMACVMQVAAGINPDVYTFTSLISACGLRQQAQTAQQLVCTKSCSAY